MATLKVSFELTDNDDNVIQTGMQIFNEPELTAGSVGATIEIKYDKEIQSVDFVGTRPRDRK